jgi:hypothetical protein
VKPSAIQICHPWNRQLSQHGCEIRAARSLSLSRGLANDALRKPDYDSYKGRCCTRIWSPELYPVQEAMHVLVHKNDMQYGTVYTQQKYTRRKK